jgi:integrase/recombinase XerC
VRNLVPSEIQRLLAVIPERSPFGARDHGLVRLIYFTGLRVGELVGLDVGLVWAYGQPKSELELPARLCKTARSRRVPLEPEAQQAIRDLVAFLVLRGFSTAPASPLLTDRHHRRLPAREVQRAMQKYRELAELAFRATPHSLRHGMATELVRQAVPIRSVQQLLGHKRLSSTEVYLHSQPAELREAVSQLKL